MPFTGLFRTAVLGVALIKEWDVFHPPDFLGVPAIAGGRIYSGACETRGELNPACFTQPLLISTAAPNGDSSGGLALGSW